MFETVKEILSRYTPERPIQEDTLLEAELGLSSFDVVSVVTDFEDQFHIEIPDRDLGRFITVKDIVNYLEERI